MTLRLSPPFRADHVGSLLRPLRLKQARAQREHGEITGEQLKAIEDREIAAVIKRQEDIGLKAVTDGEFRRAFWNYDFLGRLPGVEAYLGERKIKFQGPNPKPMMLRVTGKLGSFSGHPMLDHFKFVAAPTAVVPKMTIAMHLCRGNFQSTFVASGGYEPVAEILFNAINVHGYFMEYDSDRAGGFEPLRLVPKGKTVVLGLVTSKSGRLESKDEIKRRIEQAAKYIPLDHLCLSPQCGFASTEEANILAEDEQWAKLKMIVEIAEEVWG